MLRRAGLATAAATAVIFGLVNSASSVPRKPDGALVKGPYLQRVTPTSITIMWQNARAAAGHITLRGPDGERTIAVEECEICEVEVAALTPASRYTYRVEVDGDSEAARLPQARRNGEFATAPLPGENVAVSFIVYGDTRQYTERHRRLIQRAATEVPDFLVATGDMVDEGSKLDQWQRFFDVESELLIDNVLYPALGNHDRQGRGRTADTYRQFFSLPENSPKPEREYAFTYARVRMIILDSNAASGALREQTAWLEHELVTARNSAEIDHIFIAMHHPIYSVSLHGGHRDLRATWSPLFEKYRVAAVFSGHDHVYSRAEANGIRYLVSGGGGAPLYPRSPRASAIDLNAVKAFERVNHYLRVQVRGPQIEITAVRVDGTVIETIAWRDATVSSQPPAVSEIAQATTSAQPALLPAVGGAPSNNATVGPSRQAGSVRWWLGGAVVALLLLAALAAQLLRR